MNDAELTELYGFPLRVRADPTYPAIEIGGARVTRIYADESLELTAAEYGDVIRFRVEQAVRLHTGGLLSIFTWPG